MHVYCSRALSVVFQGLQKVLHAIEVAVVQFAQVHLVYIIMSLHTYVTIKGLGQLDHINTYQHL